MNWKAILSLEDFQKDPEVPQVTMWRCELGEDALVGDQDLLGSSSAIQLGLDDKPGCTICLHRFCLAMMKLMIMVKLMQRLIF